MRRSRISKWVVLALLLFAPYVFAGCGEAKREAEAPAQGVERDAVGDIPGATPLASIEELMAKDARIKELLANRDAEIKLTPGTDTATMYWWTGNDLWEAFASKSSFDQGATLGYIIGVKDALGAVYGEIGYLAITYGEAIKPEYPNLESPLWVAEKVGKRIWAQTWIFDKAQAHEHWALIAKLLTALENPKGDKVTAGQVEDVVKKYLSDHPEERALPAALLVWRAVSSLEDAQTLADYSESQRKKIEEILSKAEQ